MIEKRFIRQIALFGRKGMERIRKAIPCLIGLGGNGSAVLNLLAHIGFDNIYLVERGNHLIQESDLNRFFLLGKESDVGRPKIRVAEEWLKRFNSSIDYHLIPHDVRSKAGKEAIQKSGIVISAVDNNETRCFLQEICYLERRILLDIASGVLGTKDNFRFFGSRASLYIPGEACLFCQGLTREPVKQPHLSSVTPNVEIAARAVEMLISYLTGVGKKVNCVVNDSLSHRTEALFLQRRENCSFCKKEKPERLASAKNLSEGSLSEKAMLRKNHQEKTTFKKED